MEPIAKMKSMNANSRRNHATLENVTMVLATSHATAPTLVLMAHDVKTTLWIARLVHATCMEVAPIKSMTLVVNATQVILEIPVNTDHALQICVNMVVHAKTKQMVIIAIVSQAWVLMVQIVRPRSSVSNS